jgi:hypothetical protein
VGQKQCAASHACRRERRLGAGVTAADYDDVESGGKQHVDCLENGGATKPGIIRQTHRDGERPVPRGTMKQRFTWNTGNLGIRRAARFANGQLDGGLTGLRLPSRNGIEERFGALASEFARGNAHRGERWQSVTRECRVAEADD